MSKVAVVTGGTSGIGRATALALKDAGYTVYELSRRAEGVEGLHHISADVTDQQAVNDAVAQIMEAEGHIDVLVNNAGFGISGAIEFTETTEAKALFDVNFFGMVNMNRAVVPLMRQAGRGRIVNLSSVAAPVPIPFQAYYSATKAAVNAYTMALANELRPFGVTVCAVMPGDIHTGFTAARRKVSAGQGRGVHRQRSHAGGTSPPAVRHTLRLQVLHLPGQGAAGTVFELAHLLPVRKIRTKALPGGEGLSLHDTPPPAKPGAAWFTSSAEGSFRRRQ